MKKEDLKAKAQEVYDAIVNSTVVLKEGTISQKDLASIWGLTYVDNPSHGDHCRELWDIIECINGDPDFEYLIIADNYEYWVASKEEAQDKYAKLMTKAAKAFYRASGIACKMAKNGQSDLLTGQVHNPYQEA